MTDTLVVYGMILGLILLVIWGSTPSLRPRWWTWLAKKVQDWLGDDPKNPRGYD